MSALDQIQTRLRAAKPEDLERWQRLYAGQPETLKLIEQETSRRKKLEAQATYRQNLNQSTR